MMDLLQWGLGWLGDQRRSHLPQPVAYERPGESAEVLATIRQTLFELMGDYASPIFRTLACAARWSRLAGFDYGARGSRL
ncbi:MAG: hypothetical protein JXB62_17970, partial [Pirellulales bacterium]|nr:hypothetical protein [Pirellulales bacterium]